MKLTINKPCEVEVAFLSAVCGGVYWEDATVNGVQDDEGTLIPCRHNDTWCPLIDVDTGKILDWPQGTVASVHYKVCDEGGYTLLDKNRNLILYYEGYVPKCMCPGGDGFGDYVIMTIDGDGVIEGWEADFSDFKG